jgi:hypothetical protein
MPRPLNAGNFSVKGPEPRGPALALRLSASVDTELRRAVGWQSKENNPQLRDFVEEAVRQALNGSAPAPGRYDAERIRTAARRVAMTVQPRERAKIVKLFDALLGELLAGE